MARPAISANVTAKHLTKAEKSAKAETETKLKGKTDKIRPPKYFTAEQKKIFKFIVRELESSEILGNLDIFVLAECAVAIDRLQRIEEEINEDNTLLTDKEFMSNKEKYSRIFFRCCNELCLSPQSRAKVGNMSMNAEKVNPLAEILSDD